jgi:hypothetical protein
MKLYHLTSFDAGRAIMRDGFREERLPGMVEGDLRHVSLPAVVDDSEGARNDKACIEVDVPDEVAGKHELVRRLSDNERPPDCPADMNAVVTEWLIPATVLNAFARRMLSDEEREAIRSFPVQFRRIDR